MSGHKIKIAARLRPKIPGEIDDEGIQVIHADTGSNIRVPNPRDLSQIFNFPFSSCYGPDSTQGEIFENDVAPLIEVVYSGVTVTVFAYGVTSSGKTHTMQGNKSEPGIIPRVVREMFHHKATLNKASVDLVVSYMEIYKDECYDLLVQRETAPKLPVRENDAGQVFVANLTSIPIDSVEEFDLIYARASKHRSVGSTNLNNASSRSHAVLTIEVTMTDSEAHTTLTGKINLVDLAGSENNKLTGNDSIRMAESAAINKSLSVLGQVVHALNQGASRIPYRNSKLTRILQDALGGSSVGLLICNLAPGTKFRQDSLNTLNFAVRTKNVENRPVVNERDTRPQPKPHFAAVQAAAPRLPPAVLQPSQISSNNLPGPSRGRISIGGAGMTTRNGPRPSLAGPPSRMPRASNAFMGKGRPSIGGSGLAMWGEQPSMQLTDVDLDERIARAVEAEVARRLKEHERQREREEAEKRVKEEEEEQQRLLQQRESSITISDSERTFSSFDSQDRRSQSMSLPSGILTPLLRSHRDLDSQMRSRLREMEERMEMGNKETKLASVQSPSSRKKTGRAYVSLARAHSEKGDLQVALDLYRKAETYVPDNIKLKERILEIEWTIKNGREFVPSPRKVRKPKSKKRKPRMATTEESDLDAQTTEGGEIEIPVAGPSGLDPVNVPLKRIVEEDEDFEEDQVESLLKRARHEEGVKVEEV